MSTAEVDIQVNSSHTKSLSLGTNNRQRQYRKQWDKLAKQKARLVFLLKCRRHNLTPRFIVDKVSHLFKSYTEIPTIIRRKVNKLSCDLKQRLLNIEISSCNNDITKLEHHILELNLTLPDECIDEVKHASKMSFANNLKVANAKVYKKFTKLLKTQDHIPDIEFDDSFIKNLTEIEIPKDVQTILSLGPKFSILPGKDPLLDLASDVELAIKRELPNDSKRTARGNAQFAISKFAKQNIKANRIDRFLLNSIKTTKNFLRQHPEIMVSNSDKGNVTIVSTKEDYESKIEALLNDTNAFTPLASDPTTKVKNLVNKCLDDLYKEGYMQEKLKTSLKSFNTIPPRLFGQIKFHKVGNPVRPIVSTVNSAAYKMSRYLATILRKSFTSKYSVKNAQQFVKKFRHITLTVGNKLVSFDVVNCFGQIPTGLATQLIERDFHLVEMHTPIPKERFIKMLEICLKEASYFVYKGKYYRQNLGMFMGSSLAPILVERVIEEFVDRALKDLNLKPDFWATYVDDHLTSIPDSMITVLKDQLNSYDDNVEFTVEEQHKATNSINFLDLTVQNLGSKLRTKWYHKSIASNRILNYHSKHPTKMKLNVAKSFIRRVLYVSHATYHDDNIFEIKRILAKNNFPDEIVNSLIHQVKNCPNRRTNVTCPSYPFLDTAQPIEVRKSGPMANSTMINGNVDNEITITPRVKLPKSALGFAGLTYVPGITEILTKHLHRHAPDLKIASRPPNKVSQVFSDMKHKIECHQNSFVVYLIPCKECRKFYIGETTRTIYERCTQHQRDVNNIAKKPKKTALVAHVNKTKHEFDFDATTILKKVRSKGLLKIHEANQIILHEDSAVNFKKDAKHVSPVFYNLIKQSPNFKKRKKPRIVQHSSVNTTITQQSSELPLIDSLQQVF